MYQAFYGFKEQPFTLVPDPAFLYMGKKHSHAFSILEYGLMNRAGLTVVTGEVGSGKTTLIQHLLGVLDDNFTVGLINTTHEKMGKLLRWVLCAFNQEFSGNSRVALHDAFTDFLIDQYANKRRTVLIIDEAQNLSSKMLEELRMLLNINVHKQMVLQLILVGQPQLRELMRQPELLQFRQRVSADLHLQALEENETRAYILHRTRHAGCERALFTNAACDLVYRASKGIPRVINTICDNALVFGYARQKETITVDVIEQVLGQMREAGSLPAGDFGCTDDRPAAALENRDDQ